MYDAYEFYLQAGLYDAAHDIAVLQLAPDAVVRQDLILLRELLEPFEGRSVSGWNERGKVGGFCTNHWSRRVIIDICPFFYRRSSTTRTPSPASPSFASVSSRETAFSVWTSLQSLTNWRAAFQSSSASSRMFFQTGQTSGTMLPSRR